MSQLNINDLPPEMLIKIFRLLDAETLKNATLACKLWNNLIESGCRWSVSLCYSELRQCVQTMNFMLTAKRKFGKLLISNVHLSEDDQIFEIFRRQGFNIVELCLNGCRIHPVVFAQLLNLTPNLESLNIKFLEIDNVTDVPLDPVLPELKKLKILCMTQSAIIECFRNAKLTTIRLYDQDTVNFLASLVKFVESQAESLTKMELGWNLPISVYECVFNRLPKLRTLIVSLEFLHRIPGFYDRLKENQSVCTLIISNVGSYRGLLGEILKRLPNIRSVIIPLCWKVKEDNLEAMAQHLGRLESLSMLCIDSICYVKFGNLRTLHIGFLWRKINWNEFTNANPRLVELIIENIVTRDNEPPLTSDDIDQITTNADLQYLRLGVGFEADDRFFEIIREKCTNLKVLELHTSCVRHGLRHNVEINVLRLCEKINSPPWLC